jgi:glycosidase
MVLIGCTKKNNPTVSNSSTIIIQNEKESNLFNKITELNNLLNQYPSLILGDLEIIKAEGSILIIEKSYFSEKIIVVINNGPVEQSIESDIQYGKLKDLLTDEIKFINDRKFEFNIPPYSYSFYKVI